MKKTFIFLFLSFITASWIAINGQSTIPSSGGKADGTNGNVEFTAGQIAYTSIYGSEGVLLQGVQQPYEITIITDINIPGDIKLSFSVFPNPASDFLKLKIDNYIIDNLWYILFDLSGHIIAKTRIHGNETIIPMDHLSSSIYFLEVSENNNVIKVFKIIKN